MRLLPRSLPTSKTFGGVGGFALAQERGENTAQGSHHIDLWFKTRQASHTSREGWYRQPSTSSELCWCSSRSAGVTEALGTEKGRTPLCTGDGDRASLLMPISRFNPSALSPSEREPRWTARDGQNGRKREPWSGYASATTPPATP